MIQLCEVAWIWIMPKTRPHQASLRQIKYNKMVENPSMLGGGNSNIVYIYPDPYLGFVIQFEGPHIFQMGWWKTTKLGKWLITMA